MIRGHIDFVSRTRVEGWLHSDMMPLAGTRLLAFVDDDCVGAGAIDLFRVDLLQAGIGDGLAGFGFSIELKASHDPRILDIRFEGGSALMRQTHTRLIPRDDFGVEWRRIPRDPRNLEWMQKRGWLTPDQFEVLRLLAQFGVYRQRLSQLNIEDMSAAAQQILQLHMQMDVTSSVRDELWGEHLPELRDDLHAQFPTVAPVVALWAPWTNCLNVVEGTHLDSRSSESGSGIDYEFGSDFLLWLNLDTNFHAPTGGLTSPLTAFVPALL